MIEIKFKDFFNAIKKNYLQDPTKSKKIEYEKDKIVEVKLGNNANRYILVLEDERDLIDSFIINFNTMIRLKAKKDEVIIQEEIYPDNINIKHETIALALEGILENLSGISTHAIKYPEATNSAGQLFYRDDKVVNGKLLLNSAHFSKKEKIYYKNATEIKYSRPFANEFLYESRIISYIEIFQNIENYPEFKQFIENLFKDKSSLLKEACLRFKENIIDVKESNAIVNLPINGSYLSIAPICSAKILNEISSTYSRFSEGYYLKMQSIAVGGTNPQNSSDYNSHVGGFQKLFVSSIPTFNFDEIVKKQRKIYQFKSSFKSVLKNPQRFIYQQRTNANGKIKAHIEYILGISFKEDLQGYEKNRLESSLFIAELVKEVFSDIDLIFKNIQSIFDNIDLEKIGYNDKFYYLINLFGNAEEINNATSQNETIFNEGLKKFKEIEKNNYRNLQDDLVLDALDMIESAIRKEAKINNGYFNNDVRDQCQEVIEKFIRSFN